ncbi:MAG: Ig-like domain repeat protein [Ilumatobacter sp.]|nr:Ig-like domain repeat protein [Ilumatobacter sp.]
MSAAPTVTTGGPFTYVEQAAPLNVGAGTSISGGSFYDGRTIEFEIDGATADEQLALESVSTAVRTDGEVSVVGSTIYIGDGTQAVPVGSVDATYDGSNGSMLRVILGSDFRNPSFEDGGSSPWTVMNQNIDLGVTAIAGYPVLDQTTYPTSCNGSTTNGNCPPTRDTYVANSYYSGIDTNYASDGTSSLRLWSTVTTPQCAVVHGPAAYSNAFDAAAGDTLYFDWKAANGGDAFHVYGYLLNTATGAQTPVLDQMQIRDGQPPTPWAQAAAVVPSTGTYRFVFVSGTFDASCGTVAGASLYLDNFQVYGSGKIDDVIWSKIAEKLTYENLSDDPAPVRTIGLTTSNSSDEVATGSITVDITPVNDVPTSDMIEVQWENTNAPSPSFADIVGTLAFSDPDDVSLTYDIVGGVDGSYDVGGVAYDVSFTGNYGTLYVDSTTGQYRLVADTAAVSSVVDDPAFETFPVAAFDGEDTGTADLRLGVTLPPAPRNVTGVPGDGQVAVSWDPPTDMPVDLTGYVATSTPDGATCSTSGALTCTVTGLSNGTSYTFTVVPTTSSGNGTTSLPSAAITPVGLPTAPQNVIGTAGDGRALVSWDPPANDGGTPITGYTVTTSPGGATCSTTSRLDCTVLGLAVGSTYTFTVVATNAQGDSIPSAPVWVTIRAVSTTSLALSDDDIDLGDSVTLTATVTGTSPTGTVEFFADGDSIGTAPVAGGVAQLPGEPPYPGSFMMTAVYSGDSGNNPSTSAPVALNVKAIADVALATSDASPADGDEVTLTATVTGNAPGGTVEFFDGATSLGTAPVSGGEAELAIDTLTAGAHSLHAVYSGDTENTAATTDPVEVSVRTTAGSSVTVDDDAPVLGDEITLTATVLGNSPTGTVEFFDGVDSLGTEVLVDGTASLSTSALTAGPHSVTVRYGGDSLNTGDVSAPLAIMVRTEATVAVAPSTASPLVGDPVTLTATVIGNVPGGTVEFFDGTTSLGTAPVDASAALLSVPSLTAGAHTITAVYSGDAANVGATSGDLTVTAVKTAATSTTSLSPAQPLVGGTITVTVTVAGRNPTGTVEVFVNGTSAGTAAVDGGTATLEVPAAAAGSTRIRAVYSGDAANSSAEAPSASVVVAKHTASIGIGVRGPAKVMVGSEVTLTATVEGRSPTGTVDFIVADNTHQAGLIQFVGGSTGSLGSAPLIDGVATLTVDSLAVGTYSVMAEYSGDAQNLPDTSSLAEVRVYALPTPMTPEPTPTTGGPLPVSGSGYEPGTTVDLWLDGEGGTLLGTVTVDESGSFSTQVKLPTTALGNHAIVVSGTDAVGAATTAAVPVEVTGTLPSTGSSAGPIAQFAMLLLVGGAALVVVTRRRQRTQSAR